MQFSHPLARTASYWRSDSLDNGGHEIFVIVTTLELDTHHKRFKPAKVEKLREAAKDYLREQNPDVRQILLMNPMKN